MTVESASPINALVTAAQAVAGVLEELNLEASEIVAQSVAWLY